MKRKQIGLREAVSVGIGGMVGGGIFAVLGLAVSLAKGGTPIAFLLAGCIALITAYSYSKLSLSYPNRGGTVKFINEGFGKSVLSGTINNILWVSYIIMIALYSSAFGSYASNLLPITDSTSIDFHIYATGVILLTTLINYYSLRVVGVIESYAVLIKISILLIFVVLGTYGLIGNENLSQLSLNPWESPLRLLAGGMVIFVAYEGFELIANIAPDIKNPKKNIPKAFFYSVLFVIALYIIIATITVGSLPFDTIEYAKDYALAESAKPILGQIGFSIITIAALISTFSAINASLYGGSRVNYKIAKDDELPHAFTDQLWHQPIGLLITAIAAGLFANTLNLESISTSGSVGFLLVFAAVNVVSIKLGKKIHIQKAIPILGFILCFLALALLIIQQFSTNILGGILTVAFVTLCFMLEFTYKKWDIIQHSTT